MDDQFQTYGSAMHNAPWMQTGFLDPIEDECLKGLGDSSSFAHELSEPFQQHVATNFHGEDYSNVGELPSDFRDSHTCEGDSQARIYCNFFARALPSGQVSKFEEAQKSTASFSFSQSPLPQSQDSIFQCQQAGCPHPQFKDNAGLQRHTREVHHSTETRKIFTCPIKTCKRNLKGFARKYTLRDHLRHFHPKFAEEPTELLAQTSPLEQQRENFPTQDGAFTENPNPVSSGNGLGESLAQRLVRLKNIRQELEKDIKAIERTLDIMN